MKIQLINTQSAFDEKLFGDEMYDPISIKKLSKEKREFYKEYGITHEMDMRTFLLLSEMFILKYTEKKDGMDSRYSYSDIFVPDYGRIKGMRYNTLDAFRTWDENIHQKNLKEPYVKLLDFFQKEIPVLNYHFYNLAFTRLNATSMDLWKSSFYNIEPYMKAVQDFKEKFYEVVDFIKFKYDLDIVASSNVEFDNKHKSAESSFLSAIRRNIVQESKNVFWDKQRKKEMRYEVTEACISFFDENIMLMNFHFAHYKNMHKKYTVSALKGIREDKDNLSFSLIDEVENINYTQFFFEVILARSLSDIFDPIEYEEIDILKNYGVKLYEIKRKAIYLQYMSKLELYKNNNGGSRMYSNFDKIFRELTLSKKIDDLDLEKDNKSQRKKI